jgi:hypothetical protein
VAAQTSSEKTLLQVHDTKEELVEIPVKNNVTHQHHKHQPQNQSLSTTSTENLVPNYHIAQVHHPALQ